MSKEFSGAPQFVKYLGPVLQALQQLGGSGRPDEVRSVIAQTLKLSEEEQSEPLPSKAQPRFDNQVHWARFYLSKAGLLDSSKRGVWALTESGRSVLPLGSAEARKVFREVS
jgi:restriction system protein